MPIPCRNSRRFHSLKNLSFIFNSQLLRRRKKEEGRRKRDNSQLLTRSGGHGGHRPYKMSTVNYQLSTINRSVRYQFLNFANSPIKQQTSYANDKHR
ncbi:MAG: hypothetical protein HC849_21300 [Oscillatoriales cyanobacterium RU_3_3]|nr:hypothetical protein [Oscillatoriales cyanobacterium RU_3_3]